MNRNRITSNLGGVLILIALLVPACATPRTMDTAGVPVGPRIEQWESRASFAMPDDPAQRAQIGCASEWLEAHVEVIPIDDMPEHFRVVAWKDPSLHSLDANHLAGYLVTDTFWAAHALELTHPELSEEMIAGLRAVGWHGNGMHEVLFVGLDHVAHKPAAADWMHGESLGSYVVGDGRQVDVRVLTQAWDEAFAVGHPSMFAEHAIYEALNHHWNGQDDEARRMIDSIIQQQGGDDPVDWIFWDAELQVLVDMVNYEDWAAVQGGQLASLRSWSFKLALLLYALEVTDAAGDYPDVVAGLRHRLAQAQHPDGGVCHELLISADGPAIPSVYCSGEATAALMLALTVQPAQD